MKKLSKKKLLDAIKGDLIQLGYLFFNDGVSGAEGLFVKPYMENMYLSLGITISNFYEFEFTASYYLSKTTRWGAVWGDIPSESYRRIGAFLNLEERKILLREMYENLKIFDVWWDFSDLNAVSSFLSAVKISESRFLNQASLVKEIDNSSEIRELQKMVLETIEIVDEREDGNIETFVKLKSTPNCFIEAAEIILMKNFKKNNPNLVKQLAADSWRIFVIQRSRI